MGNQSQDLVKSRQTGIAVERMTNMDRGYGLDGGATYVSLLALLARGDRRFSVLPVKFYRLPQQLFQTMTLALASDCRRSYRRSADGQTRGYSVRPPC